MSNNTSVNETFYSVPMIGIPRSVQFWTYLISNVLSIPCCLFVLYYLLFNRTFRYALNNHVIIILLLIDLIYELTFIPWTLHHLYYGVPWLQTPIFYLFTYYIDYGFYSAHISLLCWATIERHMLIFHDRWIMTGKKRLFFHYLPILIILIYRLVYFTLIMFGSFCENSFDLFIFTGVFIPCVFNKTNLGTFEILIHQVMPILIVIIFSVALTLRVLLQKRRLNQHLNWRKYRKMTVQLLLISMLYLIFNSPWTIVVVTLQFGVSVEAGIIVMPYVVFFRTYVIFLFPYVCFVSLPKHPFKRKRIVAWCRRRQQRVLPQEDLRMQHTLNRPAVKANTNHPHL